MNDVDETLRRLSNPTMASYLALMADTETPAIFHAWTLVSAAAACLTRRCWFQMGKIRIMPNMYVALVGTPGVRKTQSISYAKEMLREVEGIRFAPNNTGGFAQGLITAMQGSMNLKEEDDAINETIESLGQLNFGMNEGIEDALGGTHVLNRHALYVAAGELAGFIGMKSDGFITFLGEMWDASGEPEYTYQLKRERTKIAMPCLNIIGGITPMHFTTYLPAQAIGQGFTSRMVMVYSDEPANKVAWPEPFDEDKLKEFKQLFNWIFSTLEGEFTYTLGAKNQIIRYYDYKPPIEDARFIHYCLRRQSHLVKLAMAFAAIRMSHEVDECDVIDAHAMLAVTERKMPDCLGEYGLSPAALARTRIVDVLKNATEPMPLNRLIMATGSDLNRNDVSRALHDLTSSNQCVEVHLRDRLGTLKTGYVWPRTKNPFKQHQQVSVEYLLTETGSERLSRAASPAADLGSQITAAPDHVGDPTKFAETLAEATSVAAQGFSSVSELLKNAIARQKAAREQDE